MDAKVDSVAIPVIEEELTVDRETVETGRVRVTTVPHERVEHVHEALLRSDVIVERVPMNVEIDDLPPVREEGDTIVVPVIEERLVKKIFLVEEVRLSRQSSLHDIDQDIALRSQQVVVERNETVGDFVDRE